MSVANVAMVQVMRYNLLELLSDGKAAGVWSGKADS